MKKFLTVFISICLLSSICSANILTNNSSQLVGTELTENQAILAFENGALESSNNRNSYSSTSIIQIIQTSISDENILISGNINSGSESKPFNLTGKLYKSSLQNKGIDAYCGKLKDTYGNFEVLHFLIKKDSDFYQYVLDESLRNEKIFLLYLRDSEKNVLTFESKIDSLNLTQDSIIESATVADSCDDILWFGKIIPGEYTETEKVSTRTLYNDVVYTPVIQRNSTYFGQNWNENANGKVWVCVGDVPTAGDATFQTALKLEESLYIDGVFQSNDTNFTIQEDPTIPLTLNFGAGYNTVFRYSYWTGTYWKWGGSNVNPSLSIDFGYNLGVVTASCSLLNLSFTDSRYTDERFTVSGGAKNMGIRIPISKDLYLKNDGDRIDFIGCVSTPNSSLTANKWTDARVGWSFQINYLPDTPNHIKHTATNLGLTLSYISNVK